MRFELIPPPPNSVAVTDKTLGGGEGILTLKSFTGSCSICQPGSSGHHIVIAAAAAEFAVAPSRARVRCTRLITDIVRPSFDPEAARLVQVQPLVFICATSYQGRKPEGPGVDLKLQFDYRERGHDLLGLFCRCRPPRHGARRSTGRFSGMIEIGGGLWAILLMEQSAPNPA